MTEIKDVLVVAKTENRKTGKIPVTYRPMTTCPTDCPFLPTGEHGGCYGTGRTFAHARNATTFTVEELTWRLRLDKPVGAKYLRDRVVGDVVVDGQVDREYIAGIAEASRGADLVPFGYTHAWRMFTDADIASFRLQGYVMNASCESVDGVVAAIGRGLPVVLVSEDLPEGTMIAGKRVVTCPHETHGVKCADCGLCAKHERAAIVRFHPHGIVKKKAQQAIAAVHASEGEVA